MTQKQSHAARLPKTAAFLLLAAGTCATAQTAPTAPEGSATEPEETSEEIVVLSPFTVSSDTDRGYSVTESLAGTRVRTELKDIASSISVVNAEFLRDTGVKNAQDLLVYTTNTEVAGVGGNFAAVGNTFLDGANEGGTFLKPSQNTRVRGLDSADNTRDFFVSDIPWDSYNVDRVDLQRGPNSILFGLGSPAGIVNSSLNPASFKTAGKVENRIGSFGSLRTNIDVNYVVMDDELAVRVAAVDDDTKYRQKPAYDHSKRIYGAMRWDPKFLRIGDARSTVRMNYEHGSVRANRPRTLPPWDKITPFFNASAIDRKTYDAWEVWESGMFTTSSGNPVATGYSKNPWIVQYMGNGVQSSSNPMFFYETNSSTNPFRMIMANPDSLNGINSVGEIDGSIGFPYGSNIGIADFGEYAYFANQIDSSMFPAADKRFYKRTSLTDRSIFDYYNNLIDGPNKKEWQNWDAYNVTFEQMLFNNRVGLEVVYDRQKYDDGQTRNLNDPYISVDIRQYLMVMPASFPGAVVNENAGSAFIGSSAKNGGNSSNFSDRENFRATLFGDIRASDFLGKGWLSSILGRHVVTGLYSDETYKVESRNWVRYAVDPSWSALTGEGTLATGDVALDWITYLSTDLRGVASASGLNLQRIKAVQSPGGSYSIQVFDSTWNSDVDPAAFWWNESLYNRDATNNIYEWGKESTQSENPANYVGWTSRQFTVLNADQGDIDRLYTDVSRIRRTTESKAFTWQGYFWDDTIVGTWGYREDTQEQRSGASSSNNEASGVAQPNPPLNALDEVAGVSEGNSISWGVVLHTPKALRNKLPFGTNLSLTYSDGRNARVETRYSFAGNLLPNSKGRTKDFGVVLSTLDDKIRLKATWYRTSVTDANMSSLSSETSTLGSQTYMLRNLEGWGTYTALGYLAGFDGASSGNEWFWNWATIKENWNGDYNDPNGDLFKNHPETIAQKAAVQSWLDQLMPQSWYQAYGFNLNYSAAKAGDWANAYPGQTPTVNVGQVQPSGGGRINGTWPTGTIDNVSTGVEFELVGQITPNWNVSINASKTRAYQTALGADLVSFIEAQYAKYQTAAGDLRLWWGGGDSFRKSYETTVWAAYQFQVQTNGKMAGQLAPWRVNMVTNYNFDNGFLKGVNVGMAYRWQDKTVLGYLLNDAQDNLDPDKPIWGPTEDALDLWVGYGRSLTDKINWRIQLNLRNVGDSTHLVPWAAQPFLGSDGKPVYSGYRIQEGMTWSLTNTFSF